MKKGVMEMGFSPLNPNIHWSHPGTWIWVLGSSWQVCVYPTFIEFVCLQTGLKRRFSWCIGDIQKFEGWIDLKKGQINLAMRSSGHYLQLRIWSDEFFNPCVEIARHNSVNSLETYWDTESLQQTNTKTIFSVKTAQAFSKRPQQVTPRLSPVVWLGTNKRIDFDKLSLQSCPWTWGYAVLMARRWILEPLNTSMSWPFSAEKVTPGSNWSQDWVGDFFKASKGVFCLSHESLSNWSSLKSINHSWNPLEALDAMAAAFLSKWIHLDLKESVVTISADTGFCPPSGRLEFEEDGLHVQGLWRASRLVELSLYSKSARTLQLAVLPKPKNTRLKSAACCTKIKKDSANQGKVSFKGNLLDLELAPGAHYQLDRFEY